MDLEKTVRLKLWFNTSNQSFYVQLDDMLFIVRDSIVTAIQERHKLQITHISSVKEIQFSDRIKNT